jgi:hypothetical protein
MLAPALAALVALAAPSFIGDPEHPIADRAGVAFDAIRSMIGAAPPDRVDAESEARAVLPAQSGDPVQSPSADQTPAPVEQAAVPAVAPNEVRTEPDAKSPSPIASRRRCRTGLRKSAQSRGRREVDLSSRRVRRSQRARCPGPPIRCPVQRGLLARSQRAGR